MLSRNIMSKETPAYELISLYYSFMISEALHVAAELGIADQLAQGPKNVAQLAEAVGANIDGLERILRLLVQKDIFSINANNQYELTELSKLLCSDAAGSLRAHLQY